jgi:hypothetical protein
MINIEPLTKLIRLGLQSQYVQPFEPLNILIVGKPETGKTSFLEDLQRFDFVYYTDDLTAAPFVSELLPQIEKGKIKVIAIPDLINCMVKQKATKEGLMMLFKSMMEEGISQIQTFRKYYKPDKKGGKAKCSLFTAITAQNFNDTARFFEDTGLLSRFIPFSFSYDPLRVRHIMNHLQQEKDRTEPITYEVIKKSVTIPASPLFSQLENVASTIGKEYGAYGFRAQLSLQRLAKAAAALDKRKEIIQSDIDQILSLARWLNFDFEVV